MPTPTGQDLFNSYWYAAPGSPAKLKQEDQLSSLFRHQLQQLRQTYQLTQPTFGQEASSYIRRVRSRDHDLYVRLAHMKWNRLYQQGKEGWYNAGMLGWPDSGMLLAPRMTLRYYQPLSKRQRRRKKGADFYEICSLQIELWLPSQYPTHKPAIHLHQFRHEGRVQNHDDLEWMLTPTMICTLNDEDDWQIGVNANLVGIIDTITDWLASNLFENSRNTFA